MKMKTMMKKNKRGSLTTMFLYIFTILKFIYFENSNNIVRYSSVGLSTTRIFSTYSHKSIIIFDEVLL